MHQWPALLLAITVLLSAGCASRPTNVVEPTLVQVTPLPTNTAELPTAESTQSPPTETPVLPLSERLDLFLQKLAEEDRMSGAVLVARGDEIILSKGYGLADRDLGTPNLPTTRFRIASLTKAFTAMAIMQLQEQGKLSVNDSLCDYLSDCPTLWEPITIHQLLTHSSGLPEYDGLTTEMVAAVGEEPLLFEPGTRWSYNNAGYLLLTHIIETVSGQPYDTFLQDNIFTPLQMADTGYDHNRDDLAVGYANQFEEAATIDMAIPSGAGALYSTVEDLLRWSRALQNAELVSAETMEQIFAPHELFSGDTMGHYGYGWFVGTLNGHPAVAHSGGINGYSSDIAVFPEDALTTILLTNREDIPIRVTADTLWKWALEDE